MTFALATKAPPFAGTYWVLDDLFLAGPFPGHQDRRILEQRIAALCDLGIGQFVNLMEPDEVDHEGRPFSTYASFAEDRGARVVRHPIADLGVPTPQRMREILDVIDGSLAAGRPVYVHCWGGIGRTGTAVACWLTRHRLGEPDDALAVLAHLRSRDPQRGGRPSPETAEQRNFVMAWADR